MPRGGTRQKPLQRQRPGPGPSAPPLFPILFTVFLDLMGFGILIPIIPILLADPGSPSYLLPPGISRGTGYILFGVLTATFSLMQFLAAPILGQLSDRVGRRLVLIVSISGTCLSYVLFAVAITFRLIPLLFFSRALDGITGGVIAAAQAAIADITRPEQRVKNFGLLGAAFGLGFIIGPFLGGKLSDPSVVPWFSAAVPFWFAAGLSGLNLVFLATLFPETNPHLQRGKRIEWSRSFGNIGRAFSSERLRILFLTVFLYQSGFSFFATFASVFLIVRFSFNQGSIGDFFAAFGVCGILAQVFVVRVVSRRFAPHRVLRLSLFVTGALILAFLAATRLWVLLVVVPFFAAFNALLQANSTGLVSNSVEDSRQGQTLGINSSVQALAMAVPPVLSGLIAAAILPEAPMAVSGLLLLGAGFLFLLRYRPRQSP
jgi:DHA1 family tetracycline resistance protein-like MFS transporter